MPTTIVHVSNAASKDVFVFDMDPESGALRLMERVPVPGTDLPSPTNLPMAVSPDRRFLYAAQRALRRIQLCHRSGGRSIVTPRHDAAPMCDGVYRN